MINATTVILGILMLILGAMMTAFFTLIWKRLDRIDTRLEKIGDTVMEVKGRMDEISRHA